MGKYRGEFMKTCLGRKSYFWRAISDEFSCFLQKWKFWSSLKLGFVITFAVLSWKNALFLYRRIGWLLWSWDPEARELLDGRALMFRRLLEEKQCAGYAVDWWHDISWQHIMILFCADHTSSGNLLLGLKNFLRLIRRKNRKCSRIVNRRCVFRDPTLCGGGYADRYGFAGSQSISLR